ncbi:MAG: hypothetical protein ACR2J6_08835 [Thermoleophilaceae bacterium]
MSSGEDTRSFRVPPQAAAQINTHALLAARRFRSFELYVEGYTEALAELPEEVAGDLAGAGDPGIPVQRTALDQLAATRRELVDLAMDARAAGPENVERRHPSVEPDVKLMPMPEGDDPRAVAATLYVVRDRLMREGREAADQIDCLVEAMSSVPDPAVLALAARLERLARGLRPRGAPPGAHEPR